MAYDYAPVTTSPDDDEDLDTYAPVRPITNMAGSSPATPDPYMRGESMPPVVPSRNLAPTAAPEIRSDYQPVSIPGRSMSQPLAPLPPLNGPFSTGAFHQGSRPAIAAPSTIQPDTAVPVEAGARDAGSAIDRLGLPQQLPLQKPTRQESIAAGKREYELGRPPNSDPGAQAEYDMEHPRGSAISAQPGALGKLERVGLTALGSTRLGSTIEAVGGFGPIGEEAKLARGEKIATEQNENAARQAQTEHEQAGTEAERGRESQEEAETDLARERINQLKEKPEDKFLYHDVDDNGNAIAVFQGQNGPYTKPLDYQAGAKPSNKPNFTSPFEAFAYGSADEKKAAQDFLGIEKRLGRDNDKPSEIEERYDLYKKDPDAYRQMFGDRGTSQDQAQAARMLKYFDSQRKAINGDFTLDDATKEQKLAEIDDLEKSYRDAAQINAPSGNSRNGGGKAGSLQGQLKPGEVMVLRPDGTPGAIPKANLQKALKRGYTLAPGQGQ